jgi:hypothetical protein
MSTLTRDRCRLRRSTSARIRRPASGRPRREVRNGITRRVAEQKKLSALQARKCVYGFVAEGVWRLGADLWLLVIAGAGTDYGRRSTRICARNCG